jgi:hypothetical protein
MTRTLLLVAAILSLAVAFPLAASGGDPTETDSDPDATNTMIADFESAGRYALPADDGKFVVDDDPDVVSAACAPAQDPLECTADEGAALIQADTDADAKSPEQATVDGSVDGTSDYNIPEPLDTPDSPVDSPTTSDPGTPLDPPVDVTDPVDMSLGEADRTVRAMERGFNTRQQVDYVGDNTNRLTVAMDKIKGTNVKVHRLMVLWWDVQCHGRGTWNWAKYDAVVREADNRGIRLILNPTGSPNWARQRIRQTPLYRPPGGQEDPCRPADGTSSTAVFAHPDNLNAWAVFIRRLVLRYRQYHPLGYEIWNEENSFAFWDAVGNPNRSPALYRPPSPSAWTRLYCLAVAHIDANDTAQVGVGGLVAYRWNGWAEKDWNGHHYKWLSRMRASAFVQKAYGAQSSQCQSKHFDYVGYHPYIYARYYTRDPHVGETPEMVELRYVRSVMRKHGQTLRKVWNTEWGFPSEWPNCPPPPNCTPFTEERQRELIRREHNYLANAHETFSNHRVVYYMRHSILFNPIDAKPNPGTPDNVFNHIGLVWIDRNFPDDTTRWRNKLAYALWASLP